MGAFGISLPTVLDALGNVVGIRSGLAWGENELVPIIRDHTPALVKNGSVRMRSEEYAEIAFSVMRASGDPATAWGPAPRAAVIRDVGLRRYAAADASLHEALHQQELGSSDVAHSLLQCPARTDFDSFTSDIDRWSRLAQFDSWIYTARLAEIDEQQFLGTVGLNYGAEARTDCEKVLQAYRYERQIDPYSHEGVVSVSDPADLSALFKKASTTAPSGVHFDQAYIDYLSANLDRVESIHWRQFERLTAEYFKRQGYAVDLGPGTNDDGIDVRVWSDVPSPGDPPLMIVQCKRENSRRRIDKIIVKGLWADMQNYGAARGLVATTTYASPGAAKTIEARGYGIDIANADAIADWLRAMRSPGAGVTLAEH